jgi:hypothetical protein
MTSRPVTAQAVAALFTSSGRNATRAELDLYHAALETESDDDVREAVVLIVRGVDLGERAPSPALIIETVRAIQRRRALENPAPAIPEHTGPILSPAENAARARALRDSIRALRKTSEDADSKRLELGETA